MGGETVTDRDLLPLEIDVDAPAVLSLEMYSVVGTDGAVRRLSLEILVVLTGLLVLASDVVCRDGESEDE